MSIPQCYFQTTSFHPIRYQWNLGKNHLEKFVKLFVILDTLTNNQDGCRVHMSNGNQLKSVKNVQKNNENNEQYWTKGWQTNSQN